MARPEPILSVARPLRDHGFHPLPIESVVRETPDAISLVFAVPPELADTFVYRSGQFCNVRVQIDDRLEMRCYSMSSSPAMGEAMTVTVKRVPDGIVSNWINDHLRAGDVVELAPLTGFFQLTDTSSDLVAFAAGSGITPVLSLLKTTLATTERTVRLHYANRDRESVIFDAALHELEDLHPDRLVVVHSYDVEHGLLTSETVTVFAAAADDSSEFYICGPGPYMEIVERGLLTLGVAVPRIHIERFSQPDLPVPAPPVAPEPVGAIRVTIELNGRTDVTDHHPGTTILQTARQMGMAPPFSCESGNCATCMARLVGGSVSMFVNNALTPEEVDDGWILTCQSVPIASAVHVVYETTTSTEMAHLPVDDIIEIEQLLARYALAMTMVEIESVMEVFTPDGTYSAFGDTYRLSDFPSLVAAAPKGLFLVGPAVLELATDTGTGRQPLCFVEQKTHDMRIGWYTDSYRRTAQGWRLHTRAMTFIRKSGARDSGKPHDPTRPLPAH